MQTIETTDPKVALRFRIALFNNKRIAFMQDGSEMAGLVRSVSKGKSSDPASWIITFTSHKPAVNPVKPRARLRRSVSDD